VLLQNDKAIFYHPLDDPIESLKSVAWTESTAIISPAKVSSGLFGELSIDPFGTQTTFFPSGLFDIRAVAVGSTKVVVAYRSGTTGQAHVGTVSGADITFGAGTQFLSSATTPLAIASAGTDKVVIVYEDGSNGDAIVGTVSGTDITFGATATFNAGSTQKLDILDLGSSKVMVSYSVGTAGASAKVGTVIGSDVTFGAATEFRSGNTGQQAVAFLSSTSFAVVYRELTVAGDALSKVGTVSGTDNTFGAETNVTSAMSGSDRSLDAVGLSATTFVVVYVNPTTKAKVGTVSGTSVTYGLEASFSGSGQVESERISSSQFAVVYQDTIGPGQTILGTVSGADVTFAAAVEHDATSALLNSVALVGSSLAVFHKRTSGRAEVGVLSANGSLTGVSASYNTAVAATKVAFVGWLRNPSA